MEKGTVIYVGAFEMPDKNAAAHRVSSVGKIFGVLGFHTVFLGRAPGRESFSGVRKSDFSDDVYEISEPASTKEWVKYMFDTSAVEDVCRRYNDVRMIIMYDMPYFSFLAVKKSFSKKGIKVVYDCAEWADATEGSFLKRYYKKFDDMLIRKCLSGKADGIICISRMMEKAYKNNNHLLRLPPMVDINDEIWHQEKEDHSDIFEFCFAGTIGSSKDCIDRIISSFSVLPGEKIRLRIIGMTKDDFCVAFPSEKEKSDDKRIIFMGRLSHRDTVRYVLSCDAYIFIREPSRKNNAGFPTKFVESFTCRAPVITTDTSDIKEYITASRRGTVLSALSREEITAAMEKAAKEKRENDKNTPDSTFHFESYCDITEKWLRGF